MIYKSQIDNMSNEEMSNDNDDLQKEKNVAHKQTALNAKTLFAIR